MLAGTARPLGEERVHVRHNFLRVRAVCAPKVDYGGALSFATIREMPVAGDESEEHAELFFATAAELTLARLHQELIAGLQILQLDLAAGGVEVVPLDSLDLVAIAGRDAIHVGGR